MNNSTKVKLLILIVLAWAYVRGGGIILPVVDPAPIQTKAIVIIEESSSRGRIPPTQLSILTSTLLKDRYQKLGVPFIVVDIDQDLAGGPFAEVEGLEIPSTPWIVASNGKSGVNESLPLTMEATQELLDKYFQ